ncbi:cleavage and polyadenylation specificity factor subunit 6-like protein [Dinothrombium tinctorium]|uniref:Cleavage and polyadenylation specificity factor subunit 6 n=1 Tax=Dinothrombium tinctorium TaxID=1965070 RepID=A0A443RQW8_9ACAR|nr:cleavage and polyadenylation specificity factor subunit 6-like protein [Dinothrombium tinctorium]
MATDGGEIDLYADDLEHEFNQENEYNNDQMVDLYDDVITASNSAKRDHNEEDYNGNDESNNSHSTNDHSLSVNLGDSGQGSLKKIGIYVGNLTWWTTDQDIIDAINAIGISDILEVKFFENRANGQSKGFCVVTLGSESSVRNVIEKLPKTELHGQNPIVTPCNKQNLNHFEMQSRKLAPGGGGNQQMAGHQSGPRAYGGPQAGGAMRPPLISRPQRPNGPLIPGQPRMPMPQSGSGPFGQGQPPWHPSMTPTSGPPRGAPPMHSGGPQRPGMPMMRMPPGNRGPGPQPLLRAPGPPGDPRAQHPQQMQEWGDHQGHGHPPPPANNMNMNQGAPTTAPMPPRPPVPGMPPVGVGGPHPGPAPHVNPAFFQPQHQGVPSSQAADPYSRVPGGPNQYCGDYRGPLGGGDSLVPSLSEPEFEEQINKNRAVCSSAISRAVADASAGDYSNAIETLVTAISLIKQSKVAADERCKILVSSLQDTLHGIESKSYGSRSKDRPRSRDRSRERSSRSSKSSRRDRSRSRERDYRERSRDRDRYHDERYHEDRYLAVIKYFVNHLLMVR